MNNRNDLSNATLRVHVVSPLTRNKQPWHANRSKHFRQNFTLAAILFLILYLPLHTFSQLVSQQKKYNTIRPITNEFVERELRKHREALRDSPEFTEKNESTHLQLAAILSQQGDPNGAIQEYQAALALNPSLSEAYRDLGAVYIDKHEWQKAEQSLRKGTELNQQDHRAWYWLGRSLIAQEHFPQAREALVTAIQIDPTNPQLHSDLGLALMAQGHFKKAGETLRHAISLQPDFAEAHDRLERVRDAHDNSEKLILEARDILDTLFRRE